MVTQGFPDTFLMMRGDVTRGLTEAEASHIAALEHVTLDRRGGCGRPAAWDDYKGGEGTCPPPGAMRLFWSG